MSNIDFGAVITAQDKDAQAMEKCRAGITAERNRRLESGVVIPIDGYGEVPVQGREKDRINLIALADTARSLIEAGQVSQTVPFRDADNVMHQLTPPQMIEMVDKAKQAASAIYAAAWTMKDMAAPPQDYGDDSHWP
ncbi:DUF4376 domain-containing protein [Aestuariivita sp.]|jgi:hypothetical protein|uniref:DUF4376 domain-containing protein n=1 Tax=Aestuariivita sp. TaxID=1872407 RepID=UPI00216C8542|nr:DUF4376 domain-containing protein [Aestuariivita sp.]MCE8006558.1 DUF4376 domain-containing protein [Aestuariivita sp.]